MKLNICQVRKCWNVKSNEKDVIVKAAQEDITKDLQQTSHMNHLYEIENKRKAWRKEGNGQI